MTDETARKPLVFCVSSLGRRLDSISYRRLGMVEEKEKKEKFIQIDCF